MKERSSLALVGIGHIAESQIDAINLDDHWHLVAGCDIRPERSVLLPPGAKFFDSTSDFVAAVQADVFLVATPNQTHYEIGKTILSRGLNLVLEKPCCETRPELADLVSISSEKGAFFTTAFHAKHALDLEWFLRHHSELDVDLQDLTHFECRFHDPYISDATLSPKATSLGGSWLDSGINALSVIATMVPPKAMHVVDAQFSGFSINGCTDSEANVNFRFHSPECGGTGTIRTNWTTGVNSKSTRLEFGIRDREVLLDHSNEKVVLFKKGSIIRSIDLRNGKPRLVNHYSGVLAELATSFRNHRPNLEFMTEIHGLLFDAEEHRPAK